jgi:tetratricopeptide (TPR) repeat protein
MGNSTEYSTPKYYMQAAIKMHKKDKYSLDSLFTLYFQLQDIIDYNLENNAKKKSKWIGTDTIVTALMRPYLTCEKIEEFFKPKTDANGSDIALLKKVSNLLDVAKCNKTDYALDIAVKLYDQEPSGEAAVVIAKSYLGKYNQDEAISWYLKGVDGLTDSSAMGDTYQTLAGLSYKKGKYAEARTYANKALAINPNSGSAHLIIASVYMKGVSACTADGIKGASVYWAAADKAVKAKTVDPSVAEQADAVIAQARSRFVSQTDAFFNNFPVAEGGSFIVPCFGVSTIVRFSK